jgi:ferredoxin
MLLVWGDPMPLTRREFLSFVGKTAVLTGVASAIPLTVGRPITLRRPPGAVDESVFGIVCVRCGRCVSVCPQRIIRQVSPLENLLQAGTPVLVEGGVCILDFNCIKVCPSGALQPVPKERAKMGTAKVNLEKCIGCGICIKICDEIAGAISWADPKKTKVNINAGKCLGCGACVPECPTQAISLTAEGAYRPGYSWKLG